LDQISSGEIPTKEWLIGDTQTLYLSKQPYSKYCELWNPRKELVQRASVCNYKQPFVTDADEGNWTFVFGIYGKLSEETLVQEIDVKKSKENNSVRVIETTYSILYYKNIEIFGEIEFY
jgi:C1A family cysteine protease